MTKVHPQPALVEPESNKKLRRLPQVFSRVLELPLPRDTDVRVYYAPDSDHFVVPRGAAGEPGAVKVRTVRLEPWGITRVVVHTGPGEPDLEDDLVYDKWRFRLPETAIPSMTVAGYVNGRLIVIVPRGVVDDDDNSDEGIPRCLNGGRRGGGGGRFGLCGGASLVSAK